MKKIIIIACKDNQQNEHIESIKGGQKSAMDKARQRIHYLTVMTGRVWYIKETYTEDR